VQVPVKRVVLAKPEFADTIAQLGMADRLVGVSSINAIAVAPILERYRRGEVVEVGSGTHSAIEMALAVDPEVVFTFYSAFADSNTHPKLWDVGITGVPLADHFEPTPLGRSEWIKFVALFVNGERTADTMFAGLRARYEQLREVAAGVSTRPPVIVGWANSRQEWALNGGHNYFARMVADAGGRYVWDSPSMRSLDLADIEQIFHLSFDSEAWVGNQLGYRTLSSLVGSNDRLRHFGPVLRQQVFDNDGGRLPSGATPIANESLTRPDAVLADLIRILHPGLLAEPDLTYYRELPP
jgi:iron complex transport system substrate-binding protein